jgi:uncharacterized protein
MARAGFYAIHNSRIRFGRDGVWYADGQRIENSRIADLFSRHVKRGNQGEYVLEIGHERVPIEVDDTPYVVVGFDLVASDGQPFIELNDHTREPLAADSLEIGADEVLYCRVKGCAERARFLRAAYYQIAPHIHAGAMPGSFVLDCGGDSHRIRRL